MVHIRIKQALSALSLTIVVSQAARFENGTSIALAKSLESFPSVTKTTAMGSKSIFVNATTPLASANNTAPIGSNNNTCGFNCTFTVPSTRWGEWARCQPATTALAVIGRIHHIVDTDTNLTTISTSYAAQATFEYNGKMVTSAVSDIVAERSKIMNRTDVNAAGTVTALWSFSRGGLTRTLAYPTTHHVFEAGYSWDGVVPYTAEGTATCVTAGDEATPFPYEPSLPTLVSDPDAHDPLGWTYCYDQGYEKSVEPSEPPFDDVFGEGILGIISNASLCEQWASGNAPVNPVDQARFLLESTTAFVSNRPTSRSNSPPASTEKKERTSTIVDATQKSSESADDATAAPVTTNSSPVEKPKASSKPEDDNTATSKPQGQYSTSTRSHPAISTQESNPVEPSGATPPTNGKPKPTSAPSTAGGLDSLILLIQDIGQHRSPTAPERSSREQTTSPITGGPAASHRFNPIPVGSTTITANSDGRYLIGMHTLEPVSPSYETDGAAYVLDQSASAIIVNDDSTFGIPNVQNTFSIPGTITINGATATLNSASEYILEGATLMPGGLAITLSGTRVSLASDTTSVIIDSSTSALVKSAGVGDYMSAGITDSLASQTAVTTTASDGRVSVYLPTSGAASSGQSNGSRTYSDDMNWPTESSDFTAPKDATTSESDGSGAPSTADSASVVAARASIAGWFLIGVASLVILTAL
ncbi:hypothetical protein Q7P37_006170 [Cladosporium fusiforme]